MFVIAVFLVIWVTQMKKKVVFFHLILKRKKQINELLKMDILYGIHQESIKKVTPRGKMSNLDRG